MLVIISHKLTDKCELCLRECSAHRRKGDSSRQGIIGPD